MIGSNRDVLIDVAGIRRWAEGRQSDGEEAEKVSHLGGLVVWCLVSGVWCLVSGVWWLVAGVGAISSPTPKGFHSIAQGREQSERTLGG
jgi:hypothetical protein